MDTVVSIEAARGERDDAWGPTREDAAALQAARSFLAYQRAAALGAGDDELLAW